MKPLMIPWTFLAAIGLVALCSTARAIDDRILEIKPVVHVTSGQVLLVYQGRYYLVTLGTVPDDPAPNPPGGESVEARVRTWTRTVDDPAVATALGTVYGFVIRKLESGATWTTTKQALSGVTDRALTLTSKPDEWQTWRNNLNALIVDYEQRSDQLTDRAQRVQFLKDVQAGLLSASEGLAINPQVLDLLIKILIRFLEEFFNRTAALSSESPALVESSRTRLIPVIVISPQLQSPPKSVMARGAIKLNRW